MNIINNTYLSNGYWIFFFNPPIYFLQTDSQILKVHIIGYPKMPISESLGFLVFFIFWPLVHMYRGNKDFPQI